MPVMKEGGPFFTSNAAPAALFAGLAKPPETDFRGTSRRALGTDILHAARALAISVPSCRPTLDSFLLSYTHSPSLHLFIVHGVGFSLPIAA